MKRKNTSHSDSTAVKNHNVSDIKGQLRNDEGPEGYIANLTGFDVRWTHTLAVCSGRDSPLGILRPLMKLLEISCHGIPWLFGTFIAILVSHQVRMHEVLLNLFAVLLFDILVVCLIKLMARRRRPAHNKMDMFAVISVDKYSFPSGHSTRAATVTLFILSLLPVQMRYALGITIWAVLVALSRVMLGRHHIFDVFCGLVIGILQYYVFIQYLWMSRETCEGIIRPIQEELHL